MVLQRWLVGLAAVGIVTIAALACGSDGKEAGVRCVDLTVPGTIVMLPGIQFTVRNRQGQAMAHGSTITAVNAALTPTTGIVEDSLTGAVFVPVGTYGVHITKPFYRDTIIANVVVVSGTCNSVQTTNLPVILETVAGAPPVRSVAIFGTIFLATPGTQARLVAIVDADAGVSRAVTWRLSDTTMARIDQAGLVTAKCSVRGGTDTVTATSEANPAVSGSTTIGVGANGSCP